MPASRTLAVGLSLLAAPTVLAQLPVGTFTIRLETVATGLASPAQVVAPPDATDRLFIVDQTGRIRIVENGALLATPFLDLSSTIPALNAGFDERGLLGLAFHPAYATNGRFFVRYSRARAGMVGEPCFGTSRGCHEEILAEYRVSATDPNAADPASGVILFRADKPQFNHNAGGLAFGPDGMLYFGLGDGGGAHDGLADNPPSHGPIGNGQNLGSRLGKLHRIDVAVPGAYSVPADNPFVAGAVPEIWAYGLRNPYQFSFDDLPGGTGTLILADVGQNLFEEVNIVTRGGNYGWVIREGAHCFDPFAPTVPPAMCNTAGLIDPVAEYPHAVAGTPVGISIIGGFVYRGQRLPGLNGLYLFGDFSTAFGVANGNLFYADLAQPPLAQVSSLRLGATNAPLGRYVKGSGRDRAGEVYFTVSSVLGPTGTSGAVLRVAPCPSDFNGSATITVQDVFDFLTAYFSLDPRADINGTGGLTVQDIFDFLGFYFQGC